MSKLLKNIDKKLIAELSKLDKKFWTFEYDDTKELTHSIHNYPAKMIYPISRNLLSIVKKYQNIDAILDPFMGSGTVLLEGLLSGCKKIYGNDLNPLAYAITKAKTTLIKKNLENSFELIKNEIEKQYEKCNYIIENINGNISKDYDITSSINEKNNWGYNAYNILNTYLKQKKCKISIPNIKNIGFWFTPKCIIELAIIKSVISHYSNSDIKDYCFIAFSELTRLVSNRRNGEFKMYRMEPEKIKKYNPNVKDEFYKILLNNIKKMNDLVNRVGEMKTGKIILSLDDSRLLQKIPDTSIDIVITSPPYGDSRTTVAYGQFSRVSLQWCDFCKYNYAEINNIDKSLMGGEQYKKGFKYDIDSSLLKKTLDLIKKKDNVRAGEVYSFYHDLQQSLITITKKCRKNSYQFWVVGNRTVKNNIMHTDKILSEIGGKNGLKYVTTINRRICNKVMPKLNSPTNLIGKKSKTMDEEHIVVFRKL